MLGERLTLLRKKKKLTQTEIATRLHISRSTYAQYEVNRRVPEYGTLEKMADFFGVSIDYLVGRDIQKNQNTLPYGIQPIDFDKMVKLPILGTIRAGEPIFMAENIEGYEYVSPELLRGRKGFILRVKGDSMSGDRINEGDMVVCIAQEDCEPSDISVVAINGEEATLKRVKCQGEHCILSSSNTDYEPMIFLAKDVHIIGVVEMVMFRMKK